MKTICTLHALALTVLAAFALSPVAAAAQQPASDQAASQAADAHSDLYAALSEGIDQELVLNNLVRQVADQIAGSSPEVALMEAQNPGLVLELTLALRPALRSYRARVMDKYAPQFVAVLRDLLTDQEARQLAGLYRSDLGRALLGVVSANVDSGRVIDQAVAEQDITAEALEADDAATLNRSVGTFIAGLSPEQLAEMATIPSRIPAISKMPVFQERSLTIRVAMENEPPNPQEAAAVEQAVLAAFEKYRLRQQSRAPSP